MKKFEFLGFATADVCFKSYGRTLGEAFGNAALAMFDVMLETENVKPRIVKKIDVKGEDLESLMFEWLNELLFYVDAESLAFSRFDVHIDENQMRLSAKVSGEPIDQAKHKTKTDVKACTYHGMEIKQINGMWVVQVILDV